MCKIKKSECVFTKTVSVCLFLVWVLSINQFCFGDSSWVFVDPLKELAGTLGTLEIEPVWVGLGVGGG